MISPRILLIDPFGSNFFFAIESLKMGFKPYALLTCILEDIPPGFMGKFEPTVFEKIFYYEDNSRFFNILKDLNFSAVIPCDQLSLRITDKVADHLKLPGNPLYNYQNRINKGLTRKSLNDKTGDTFSFIISDKLDNIVSWSEKNGYPVILKPPESAGGSINVKKCKSADQVISAFNKISSFDKTYYKNIDGKVLAEDYLDGDEYIVNIIHTPYSKTPLALAKVDKLQLKGNASIYKNVYSVDMKSEKAQLIFNYTKKISDCLDIRYGINDTEVKLTSKGLKLVEMNNRMSGARIPYAVEKCCGVNPYKTNIKILMGENHIPEIKYTKNYNICFLINYRSGKVRNIEGLKKITGLESYNYHEIYAGIDSYIPETEDLISSWGKVILINENKDQLMKDKELVHNFMELSFYE